MAKHPTDGRRAALAEWLTANGIDPNHVPVDGDLLVFDTEQGRAIRVEVLLHTEAGAQVMDARGEAVREIRTVPLTVEPPPWFEPYEKPTREQLLAIVERVRKLHVEEYGCCSHCTREDSVLFPCPTIRALDGEEQPRV